MSLPSADALLSWPVAVYLGSVILAQLGLGRWRRSRAKNIEDQRNQAGLDGTKLVDHAVKLSCIRRESLVDAVVLASTVILVPLALTLIVEGEKENALGVLFLGLLLWTAICLSRVERE